MRLTFCLFFLLLCSPALSQERLSGRVLDAGDSTALAAVSVYYDGTSMGTVTDKNGFFGLKRYDASGAFLVIRLLSTSR